MWEVSNVGRFNEAWTLVKKEFVIGKNSLHDKYVTKIYGCIEKDCYGDTDVSTHHTFEVSAPLYDEDNPMIDCETISVFDCLEEAKQSLLSYNHSDYSSNYW